MKIDLRIHHKHDVPHPGGDTRTLVLPWAQSAPFVLNPRGILVHRVWAVSTMVRHWSDDDTNIIVKYACWNSTGIDCDASDKYLLHDVPVDRLLCQRCEEAAVKGGFPSADELCGRHVHVGHLRAIRTCCKRDRN